MFGMTRYWWRWALGKLLVLGGAISFSGNCAFAQSNIVPDNSLGAQSSVVTPNVDINGIKSELMAGQYVQLTSSTVLGNSTLIQGEEPILPILLALRTFSAE